MLHAANLVLDRKQHFAAEGIDEVLEPVLMLVALFAYQSALQKLLIRTREVRDIDLYMMAVVRWQRLIGLAKNQVLAAAG